MTTTVYIIRHAEAEGNVYRRCHGQYNALLTTRAYKQLPYLAKRFENVPLAAGLLVRPVPRTCNGSGCGRAASSLGGDPTGAARD